MVPSKLTEGTLFDIQGFSVHDGPGCRTLIFLKGCSMQCQWCSNPEGLHSFPEPLYNSKTCIFDNLCIEACKRSAITPLENRLDFNLELCRECKDPECARVCCTGALKIAGYKINVDDLMKKIQRDRQYWGSEGGITLTGGEPFMQAHFVNALLKQCHKSYIHTAAETCGNFTWDKLEKSLEYLDWIFFDLKQMDHDNHMSMTGAGNSLILENARKLAAKFKGRLIFRMPVVPGFNDSDENIVDLSSFLRSIEKDEINILPLHHLGREKYNLTGLDYYTDNFTTPSRDSLNHIQALFTEQGIHCYISSDTPF